MGFGLHAGWAIEGAVGSLQKVDATYLSPHVNMAARLETSSRQYGVPVLMSEKFYELMSDEGKEVSSDTTTHHNPYSPLTPHPPSSSNLTHSFVVGWTG